MDRNTQANFRTQARHADPATASAQVGGCIVHGQSDGVWMPVVRPVLNAKVRGLCRKPYPGHPRGCPNWNSRATCPPGAPLLSRLLDLSQPVYCAYNAFDLAAHVARMKVRHPEWSKRQLHCCLYWQGTARKQLRIRVDQFLERQPELIVLYCPEACGVDVTATMESLGISLEWPPARTTYQVALIGTPASFAR